MKYNLVVCGGTFDLFHKGHKSFLEKVFESSDKVLVGITSNLYVQAFKKDLVIEDFKIRKKAVEDFLDSIGVLERAQITAIDNAYEPYLKTSTDYQAIAVTAQTKKTALDINEERNQNGISQLEIIVIPMGLAGDGEIISSTRIRNGKLNRDGRLYVKPLWAGKTLKLPEELRSSLKRPFGKVLSSVPSVLNSNKTITIGDITTKKFNDKSIGHFFSVIDLSVARQKKFSRIYELGFDEKIKTTMVKNPPGEITWDLFDAVRKAFGSLERKVILVEGEEDLAVLPTILAAPLGYKIYYGQPNEGLVEVEITEESKEKGFELLSKFNY